MNFVMTAVVFGINAVSQGAASEPIKVNLDIVSVHPESKSARDLTVSYIRAELRALGDLRLTQSGEAPDVNFLIRVAAIVRENEPVPEAYALSLVGFTRSFNLLLHDLTITTLEDLRNHSNAVVADFDNKLLEEIRKARQP